MAIQEEGFSDDLFRIESDALADLDRVLGQQKSKFRWLAKGIEIPTSFTLWLNAKGKKVSFLHVDW